jgi:hypothetical protein
MRCQHSLASFLPGLLFKEWLEKQRQRILLSRTSDPEHKGVNLPYNGSVEHAQNAGDRDAIRAIFRMRMKATKETDSISTSQNDQTVQSQYEVLGLKYALWF